MFGKSSQSSASAQAIGGQAAINSSGWVVGNGNAKGGNVAGVPWGLIVAGAVGIYAIKKFRGAGRGL